jgi:hypothetical protein
VRQEDDESKIRIVDGGLDAVEEIPICLKARLVVLVLLWWVDGIE